MKQRSQVYDQNMMNAHIYKDMIIISLIKFVTTHHISSNNTKIINTRRKEIQNTIQTIYNML